MAVLRIIFVSLIAGVTGCTAGSILLFNELSWPSMIPVPFTVAGSILLLAPSYAAAREDGATVNQRYARLLIIGCVAGGLMLGFISLMTNPLKAVGIGATYGALTALSWIAIHAATKRIVRIEG